MIAYDIEHLVKTYPGQHKPANDDLTLQITEGEIFGLLGANGAGKTTLVRQMVNLVRPTSGRITLLGRDIAANPQWVTRQVGYMPQGGLALGSLTVSEALYYTAHLRGLSRPDASAERDKLLEQWQIGPWRHTIGSRLSGGQRRLMQLAVAMAGSPPIVILDEPTNDLDPQRRHLVWDVLRKISTEQGVTVILVTHDAIEAEKVIQRVGIMRAGRMVALGQPGDLKRQIGWKLRFELVFAPDDPPSLPEHLSLYRIEPGRWLVYVDRNQAVHLLSSLDLDRVNDFRLYSATLEDLYLHYTCETG